MEYLLLKWIHILSSTVLFGTGVGSAFYKFMADRGGDLHNIARTNRHVVLADWLFTTPTIIIQPVTGVMLADLLGFSVDIPVAARIDRTVRADRTLLVAGGVSANPHEQVVRRRHCP